MGKYNVFGLILFLFIIAVSGYDLSVYLKLKNQAPVVSQPQKNLQQAVFTDSNGVFVYPGVSKISDINGGAYQTLFLIVGKILEKPYQKENYYYVDLETPVKNGAKKVLSIKMGKVDGAMSVNYTNKGVYSNTYVVVPMATILEEFVKGLYLAIEITTKDKSGQESIYTEDVNIYGGETETKLLQPELLGDKTTVEITAGKVFFNK